MIDLDRQYLDFIISVLKELIPECEVRAFGSRVNGRAHRFSDFDLAVVSEEPLDWRRLEALKDAFAQSDLPITVDVLDWRAISADFRKIIEKGCETIWRPDKGT
jgi:uncharacterized protein